MLSALALTLGLPFALLSTPSTPVTTLRLEELVAAAAAHDPRQAEVAAYGAIEARRQANLDARFRPSLEAQGQAAYHSAVAEFPGGLIAGPPKDQYDAHLAVDRLLWDGGRTRQEKTLATVGRELEQQGVAVDFFAVRRRLERAFFAALLRRAELDLLATLQADLEAQIDTMETRVTHGVALPGDAAVLKAALEEERQRALEAAAERRAALDVLATLTGRPVPDEAVLVVPPVAVPTDALAVARGVLESSGSAGSERPELTAFALGRRLLDEQRALTALADRPVVSAFARGGVGRPADQDFLEQDPTPYAVVGVRVRWKPWDWGQARREGEIRALEQAVSVARERAFRESLSATLQEGARRMEALQQALASDERIVELREVRRRQAEAQLRQGVLTPTDYLTERNAEHRARLVWEQHRLELARQSVEFHTNLGKEP
jgi:outer membrane protein TolC